MKRCCRETDAASSTRWRRRARRPGRSAATPGPRISATAIRTGRSNPMGWARSGRCRRRTNFRVSRRRPRCSSRSTPSRSKASSRRQTRSASATRSAISPIISRTRGATSVASPRPSARRASWPGTRRAALPGTSARFAPTTVRLQSGSQSSSATSGRGSPRLRRIHRLAAHPKHRRRRRSGAPRPWTSPRNARRSSSRFCT